jgi:hypothetical protein
MLDKKVNVEEALAYKKEKKIPILNVLTDEVAFLLNSIATPAQ